MERQGRNVAIGFALVLGTFGGALVEAEPLSEFSDVPAVVQEVLEVWEARELATPTFEVHWQETVDHRPDSLVSGAVLRGEPAPQESRAVVADATTMLEFSLRVEEHTLELRSQGRQWMPEFDQFVWRDYRAAYQPPLLLRLFHTPGHPIELQGFIQRTAACPEARRLGTLPLLLAFRPLSPVFSPIATKGAWVALPGAVEVDGHPCMVIERHECRYAAALEQGELRESFWVDPALEYVVRRYELMQGECVLVQGTMEYDGVSAWPTAPTRWSLVAYGGNPAVPQECHGGKLVACKESSGVEAFQFPPGTLVNDDDSQTIWIARPNGMRRLVTKEEHQRRPTYAELLSTESGYAGRGNSGESLLLWTLIAASASGAAFRLRRRRIGKTNNSFQSVQGG